MPVILGEVSILTTPLSGVRICALVSGCITFSLVASMGDPQKPPEDAHLTLVRTFSMFTWCFFFTLSLLILTITYIQFHSLLPLSWKNLTVTVSALGALMTFTVTVAFPSLVLGEDKPREPRAAAATVFSGLTFLAYTAETFLIRLEQRGYMASVPGLLKVLQVFGGSMALLLIKDQAAHGEPATSGWKVWGPGVAYGLCLVASVSTVAVMVGDCAGRCPLPFDRVLAGLSLLGVLLYMVAAVVSSTKVLIINEKMPKSEEKPIVISEMVFTCITLLSYTVDLAFSVKLLCDRN